MDGEKSKESKDMDEIAMFIYKQGTFDAGGLFEPSAMTGHKWIDDLRDALEHIERKEGWGE